LQQIDEIVIFIKRRTKLVVEDITSAVSKEICFGITHVCCWKCGKDGTFLTGCGGGGGRRPAPVVVNLGFYFYYFLKYKFFIFSFVNGIGPGSLQKE
jgi:hypothetical protein